MKYIQNLRQTINENGKNILNRLYDGLGDIAGAQLTKKSVVIAGGLGIAMLSAANASAGYENLGTANPRETINFILNVPQQVKGNMAEDWCLKNVVANNIFYIKADQNGNDDNFASQEEMVEYRQLLNDNLGDYADKVLGNMNGKTEKKEWNLLKLKMYDNPGSEVILGYTPKHNDLEKQAQENKSSYNQPVQNTVYKTEGNRSGLYAQEESELSGLDKLLNERKARDTEKKQNKLNNLVKDVTRAFETVYNFDSLPVFDSVKDATQDDKSRYLKRIIQLYADRNGNNDGIVQVSEMKDFVQGMYDISKDFPDTHLGNNDGHVSIEEFDKFRKSLPGKEGIKIFYKLAIDLGATM